jgi:lipase chaperone LimK
MNRTLLIAALAFAACASPDAQISDTTSGATSAGGELKPVEVSSRSLQGTDPDGAIAWNADGTVRVDRDLRRRFDYLLSTLGETSLAQVRASLAADLRPLAPKAGVNAVLGLFDAYTACLSSASQLKGLSASDRLTAVHALRVKALGASTAQAFFQDEEALDAWATSRRAAQAQGQDLASLAALQPASQRNAEQELAELTRTTAETAAFDARAASAAERFSTRQARLGATVAQNLAALDQAHAKWNARVASFRTARDAVQADSSLDEPGRQKALSAILSRDFSEPEARRVRALELDPR